ncbi:MAG: hypothetical protein AAF636_15370 [Pseudomonadota bacterium]
MKVVRDAVLARGEGEVANAALGVEARLAEVNAPAERANDTVTRAEAQLEAICAFGPGGTRTTPSSSGEVVAERGCGGIMVVTVEGRVDGNPSSTVSGHDRLMELCSDWTDAASPRLFRHSVYLWATNGCCRASLSGQAAIAGFISRMKAKSNLRRKTKEVQKTGIYGIENSNSSFGAA